MQSSEEEDEEEEEEDEDEEEEEKSEIGKDSDDESEDDPFKIGAGGLSEDSDEDLFGSDEEAQISKQFSKGASASSSGAAGDDDSDDDDEDEDDEDKAFAASSDEDEEDTGPYGRGKATRAIPKSKSKSKAKPSKTVAKKVNGKQTLGSGAVRKKAANVDTSQFLRRSTRNSKRSSTDLEGLIDEGDLEEEDDDDDEDDELEDEEGLRSRYNRDDDDDDDDDDSDGGADKYSNDITAIKSAFKLNKKASNTSSMTAAAAAAAAVAAAAKKAAGKIYVDMEDPDGTDGRLEDFMKIQVRRNTIEKWLHEPFFANAVIGTFARMFIGNVEDTDEAVSATINSNTNPMLVTQSLPFCSYYI